jgi:tetratricopeptide (TPR) repeat protein
VSAQIPHCDRCKQERHFVRIAAVANQQSYGVEWRCIKCDEYVLDLCPVGPLAPTALTCLNCGTSFPDRGDFAECPTCGLTRLGARDIYGLDPAPADPIPLAGKLFDLGLIRRAIATLNDALVLDPTSEAAWKTKYAFLSGLHYADAALKVIEAATEFVVNPDLLISYAHTLGQLGRAKEARDVYHEYLVSSPQGEYAEVARNAIERIDAK